MPIGVALMSMFTARRSLSPGTFDEIQGNAQREENEGQKETEGGSRRAICFVDVIGKAYRCVTNGAL